MRKHRETDAEAIARLMKKFRLTLAAGESCTGGLLGHRITNISGSSHYFKGGVIAYSNKVKEQLLGVPQRVLKKFGAISEETAMAMARGARKNLDCDIGVAITGIAGPTGGSKKRPVGTVCIAIADQTKGKSQRFRLKGKRQDIKRSASNKALKMLKEFLLSEYDARR